MTSTKRLVITAGEPAGIGPDLIVLLAQSSFDAELVVVADKNLIEQRANLLDLPIHCLAYDKNAPPKPQQAGSICIEHLPCQEEVEIGQLNQVNSLYVLNSLKRAATGCMSGEFDAMVTGPVHKGIINRAGIAFTGHTEFLAELSQTPKVVMMLATEGLKVALVTTHLPLAKVSQAITETELEAVIRILHQDLQTKFGIKHPKIYVCGLNPHAGEDGHLGREEIEIISPLIQSLRQEQGFDLIGPLPADTIFNPNYLKKADAILGMYHDQVLPVLKYKGFGQSVNITLGLPFIRTSVDHGTALELAGSGQIDCGSFKTALLYALTLAQHTTTLD